MKRTMLMRYSILVFPLLSCGLKADDPAETTTRTLYQGGALWPGSPSGGYTVPVCWEIGPAINGGGGFPIPSSMHPDFATRSFWTRDAVENSWGRVANIRFVGWDDCPSLDPDQNAGRIAVHWRSATEPTNESSGIGYDASSWTRMRLNPERTEADFRSTIMHEFGHALGFAHEFVRPDNTDPGCDGDDGATTDTFGTTPDSASIMNFTYCTAADGGRLSPWDIIGVQKAYGRKHSGALVGLGGRCLNLSNFNLPGFGTDLQISDCSNVQRDRWERTADTYLRTRIGFLPVTERCVNVPFGQVSPTSGTLLSSSSCESPPSVNEQFTLNSMRWRAFGNMCVAANSATEHATLTVQACGTSSTELWDWEKVGTGVRNNRLRLAGSNLCVNVPFGRAVTHELAQLFPCGSPAWDNELYDFTADGQITTLGAAGFPALCLNVTGGLPAAGSTVQFHSCGAAGTPFRNEQFHFAGKVHWSGDQNQCLDVRGGVSVNGAKAQVHPCVTDAPNEDWEYYF